MAKKVQDQYNYLNQSGLRAAVVDIDRGELIYSTAALHNQFNDRGLKPNKWFSGFLKSPERKPEKWLNSLKKQGVTITEDDIGSDRFVITATMIHPHHANILLLQFNHRERNSSNTSERALQIIDNLPDGVVIHVDGKITYMNECAEELLGVDAEKLRNKPFLSLFKGSTKTEMEEKLNEWKSGKATEYSEFSISKGDGQNLYLGEKTVVTSTNGNIECQSIFSNLSLRKQWIQEKMRAQLAEEINQILKHEIKEHKITQYELEQARNFNLAVIESSLDMIIAENDAGIISVFNKAAEKQYGYQRDEMIGQPSSVLFKSKAEYKRVKESLAKHRQLGVEVENKRKNGEVFTSFLSASVLFTTDGKFLGTMGVSRDITQSKESAEALRKSEELYRDLFDNMSDAYLLLDTKGKLVYWNKEGLKLLGVSAKNAGEINLFNCVDKKYRSAVKSLRKTELKEKGKTIKGMEYELINTKGQRRYVLVNSSPIFENGKFSGSRELLRDISEQKQAMAEAESQSAKIRSIFESSAYMIWSVDKNYKLTSFNKNYAGHYEKLANKAPKIGNKAIGLTQAIKGTEKLEWQERYEQVFNGTTQHFESHFRDRRGKDQWYDVVLNPIGNKDGKIDEISGIAHSVTFKKQAEGKIKDQAAKINSIFDSTAMLIWTLDTEFRITSYNSNFARMLVKSFGVEIQIGKNMFEMLNPFIREDLRENFKELYTQAIQGKYVQFEGPAKKKNGQIFWMETFLNPILKEDHKVGEISCMAHEITDKKIIEKQIRESLREKEILLQEVHHRVKNNLQVISSILNLQSSYVKDPNTLSILRESQNRIKSMSFIHESLYQTTDFSSIDFSDYILSLSKNLVHSYSVNAGLVELQTNFEKVYLNLDQAIPCGLIVNELVSNALKYAFPDNREGKLMMSIKDKDSKIELIIKDDGVGVPSDFNFEESDTLGLQLVFTLIEQLDGEVAFTSKPNKGTEYLITFDKLN